MTANPTHYDVAIVGAGPAGTTCAQLLALAGWRVLLCDRAFFPRHKICGECVNPKSWPAFDRLGVTDEIERHIEIRITAISVTNMKGNEVQARTDRTRPFFSMSRDVLDQILVGAATRAGATFRDGTNVNRLSWRGHWHIDARDRRHDRNTVFTANYVVGADGRNSTIAAHLGARMGVPHSQRPHPNRGRVGVQWHTAVLPQLGGVVEMYLFPGGYGGLVNVSRRHANVALVATPEMASSAKTDFAGFLEKTLKMNPLAASRFDDVEPVGAIVTAFPINPRHQPLTHQHAELIGDAKQTVEPFTGEGILSALEDGAATADRLTGRSEDSGTLAAGRRFRANRIFSPILRSTRMRENLVSFAARWPVLSRWISRSVFPRHV